MRSLTWLGLGAAVVVAALIFWHQPKTLPLAVAQIDFNRDIRPILNQKCIACHGGVKRQRGVSFLFREEALGSGKSGKSTIIPGNPDRSEFMSRITSHDPEHRMPYEAPALASEEIELFRQWIAEGAEWEDHWAFVAPELQPLPQVRDEGWPRQTLDRFILARLDEEGLRPSPEATKPELLRRVSFDLTGLPPTPDELSAFLGDTSADAYERQVDRLLASPHFGERWASLWMDLARYADTRDLAGASTPVWPYRDWVIDAINKNIPYDQFVITQLAGDLMAEQSIEQHVATAFHRMTPGNDEAGTDDEEFRLMALMDRVATTWSVLNGVTMNCVQCHTHPYDPIRHQEYYRFLAFFNTSRDADRPDEWPTLAFPIDKSLRQEVWDAHRKRTASIRETVESGRSMANRTEWITLPIRRAFADEALGVGRFLKQLEEIPQSDNVSLKKLYDELIGKTREDLTRSSANGQVLALDVEDGEAFAPRNIPAQSAYVLEADPSPQQVTALRIEVPPVDPNEARRRPEEGFLIDRIDAWIDAPSRARERIEFAAFVHDSFDNLDFAVSAGTTAAKSLGLNAANTGGFSSYPKQHRNRWVIGIPKKPIVFSEGSRLRIQLTHTQAIGRDALVPKTDEMAQLVEAIAGKPTTAQRVRIQTSSDERWSSYANETATPRFEELLDLQRQLTGFPSIPIPVMAEQANYERRETFEFERGEFLSPVGDALSPDVPAIFPELPADQRRDRLAMAKWFFSPEQPLTARVAVNRYWEQLFGTGIVETLEDFGSAGQLPSHPDLLDWLAVHFQRDLNWDMKSLLRELVTSATYRQSASSSADLIKNDPLNRLLARGPQQRLTAEMVHDQALLAAGLLNPQIGGPPVGPPQPNEWPESTQPGRRAIYIAVLRGAVYPTFSVFDASDHRVSLARRIPTNTPLQALTTLNEPFYHIAAIELAKRMLAIEPRKYPATHVSSDLEARLNYGARCVISRDLSAEELDVLTTFFDDAAKHEVAEAELEARSKNELATFTAVASVLMNLDAALVR